jgi:hypothetical protein
LPQLVEDRSPVLEQGASIERRLDSAAAAIKQRHTQCVLEVGNRLGYDRLRHRQLLCGPRHRARADHHHQNMQIAQFQSTPNAIRPLHDFSP